VVFQLKEMCSSQSEADTASSLPRVRARRKASKVDFIDGPVDTDEENEKIEKLVEAEGDTDFFPSEVAKKKGRPRKADSRNKDTIKTDDAKTEKNNNDEIAGQESKSMHTTNTDTSADSSTSTPAKNMKMAKVHEASGLAGLGQGSVQLKLQRSSIPKDDNAGPILRNRNRDKWIVKRSVTATSESGNSSTVENKNSINIENTSIVKKYSVDIDGQSHSIINSSKCHTSEESSTSVSVKSKVIMANNVRDKVTKTDYVSGEAGDTGEENDNGEKHVEVEGDTDFPDEGNVSKNRKWKIARIENIFKINDDETEINYDDNRTEEQQAVINLTMNDTSTDSNQSPHVETMVMARFQQESLHGGSRGQIRPGQDQDGLRTPCIEDNVEGKYQQRDNHGLGGARSLEPVSKSNLIDVEGQKFHSKAPQNQTNQLFPPPASTSGQSKPGQPRMLRPIRPKMDKKSTPRITGPGQYPQCVSQSEGMVRKPGLTPVKGLRMLRPTQVTGLSGIVSRGGSHSLRRAHSFPQNNNTQNIRAPTPQPSNYPAQAALGKLSNMGTSFTRIQTPPPLASSLGEWNLPPGISISRIKESGPGSGMTVASLASALHMLGETEGTKRTVSYRLTESQIMALNILGFKQEPKM